LACPLFVGAGLVRVVGDGVAIRLQLGDGGLQLRHGRADVGQLDDVGLGAGQLAQLGERVGTRWSLRSALGEGRQDAAASEMSRVSMAMPAGAAKACRMGSREKVARAGASSVE
jgi:hypothetical protein